VALAKNAGFWYSSNMSDPQKPKNEYEAKLAALRAAIDEGEASGPPAAFDLAEFLAERHRARGTKT
jgi:Arc/MetJ-type ribon-helix-helix transcriptional regulator